MSYNIDTWKTKELADLRVPLDALHAYEELTIRLNRDTTVTISGWPEGFEMIGRRDGDTVIVTSLSFWGEGSGTAWDGFKTVLAQSRGRLVARQVWEGGDAITNLTVVDGEVTEEEIEL